MAGTTLHIIAFNIPYPADYGGIIDIYYKIKALKEAGIRTILHCFTYGRQPSKELEDLCLRVHYYPRKTGLPTQFSTLPYIVASRRANSMPENLLGDSFPVLFEGLHTTGPIIICKQAGKKVLVRMHNVEHHYYRSLARAERNPAHRLFLYVESLRLKRYEQILKHADQILGISRTDTDYFKNAYGNSVFIPAFQRFDDVVVPSGLGEYALFHGNLGVAENEGILTRMIIPELAGVRHRIIIAGKNPSAKLYRLADRHPHIEVRADPSDQEMEELIVNAQIHLLLTQQSTGIKLKLLHSLYRGRHCLVNPPMVEGTDLGELCTMVHTGTEMREQLDWLMGLPVEEKERVLRKKALLEYSNRAGAEKILRLIR